MQPDNAPFDLAEMRSRLTDEANDLRARLFEVEETLKAIDVLARHLAATAAVNPTPTLPGIEEAAPAAPPIPFAQAVREAVQSLRGIEFDVSDVEAALRKQGRELPARNLRTRITVELIPLVNKGVLTRTFRGTGKQPHRYRLKSEGEKGEGASAGTLTPSMTNSLAREPMLAA